MSKLRGIILMALLSCFVAATWGCDMQKQAPPKPKVVRKKIVSPKPATALARHSIPAAGRVTTAAKVNSSEHPPSVVKEISTAELRPKSDIAATPVGKKTSNLVAKNSREPVKKPIDTLPQQSKNVLERTAKKNTTTPVKQTAGTSKANEPLAKKVRPQPAPAVAVTMKSPGAETVPSSAAVIQPAIAPSPPKPNSGPSVSTVASSAPAEKKIAAATVKPAGGTPALYNPKGRIDPFEPLFKDEPEVAPVMAKKKKRIPRTPLERIDLGQLKLVGIIMASSGNRALVQEASGKGYIIKEGTFIGLHSGKVTEIMKDRVVIEEEVDEYVGKQKMRNKELVLPKPPGE